MTQKSRRRKAAQRVRRLSRQEEAQNTYSFYHKARIVEVVAPDLEQAQANFMQRFGYHPGATVQENLK